MVDLHAHILPGLDDGAQTLEESLEMASLAVASDIRHMAASSHGNFYDYTLAEYEEAFSVLETALMQRGIGLKLYPAMEVFLDDAAAGMLRAGSLFTINRTRYVLGEFDFEEHTETVCRRLDVLQQLGYIPVLAHPERYRCMQKDPELGYALAAGGCVLQINAGSVLGIFGARCRETAMQLMELGSVGLISTDAHDTQYRPPSFEGLKQALGKKYTDRQLHIWLSENPSRILKGRPVLKSADKTGQ